MPKYILGIKTTLLVSFRSQKKKKLITKLDLDKTSYKDLVFARGEFLRLVGAQNESLRVIIIYYMLKYTFGIKITLLESLWSQNPISRLDLAKTSYKDLIFARGEFSRLVGAQNMTLRVIILYYMPKYAFGIKTTLLESLRSQKNTFKGSI